jgi:hypothetical protein
LIAATFAHLAESEHFCKSFELQVPVLTGSLRIILDSIAKEILCLDPGLEKSIAAGKSRGKTHL